MPEEYPRNYWWLVLVVVPIAVALIPYVLSKSERGSTEPGPGSQPVRNGSAPREPGTPPSEAGREQPNCGKIWLHANPSSLSVAPGGEVTISLLTTSGDANTPVPAAEVTLGGGAGSFQVTGNRFEYGVTDGHGVYRTAWRAPEMTRNGGKFLYGLDFSAKKPGCETGEAKITVEVIAH